MYRRLKATKDTYITDKIIRNSFRATDANVGEAASLDLFKLYDESNISGQDTPFELSRILVKFDLDPLRELTGSILNLDSPTLKCEIKLYDVYGGQTIPSNFRLIAFPLSQSFDEGVGRDVTKFEDIGSANFFTASSNASAATLWFRSGSNKQGLLGSDDIDIITSGNLLDGNGIVQLGSEQLFSNGTEDLTLDVTSVISGTLAGLIPDYGFRISYSGTQETNTQSYFVKRFASRHNSNTRKRPALIVRYDDTILDHTSDFFFDLSGSVFLNSFGRGFPANLVSGSALTEITGSNSLIYRLSTGSFEKLVTASQHSFAGGSSTFMTGVYSASFAIDSFGSSSLHTSTTSTLEDMIRDSGSVTFDAFWQSFDGSVGFLTSSLTIKKLNATSFVNSETQFQVNIANIKESYPQDRKVRFRCVAFDVDEQVKSVKLPLYRVSDVLTRCFYQIRDAYSDDIIVPFDPTENSTRMSTDTNGMFFDVYTNDLDPGRSYTFDVLIKEKGNQQVFKNVGGIFRIDP